MIKKIFITGSNGFVGTSLVEELCEDNKQDNKEDNNIQIRAMVLKGTPTDKLEELKHKYDKSFNEKYSQNKIEIVYGNLLDIESLKSSIADSEIVVHLAGLVTDWAPNELFHKIIVDGTQNLITAIDELKTSKVKRIIFMSSLTVHKLNGHTYDDENTPRNMKSFYYGVAKRIAEDIIIKWADREKERDYAIIRPGFVIYGPNDPASFIRAIDGIVTGKFGLINGGKSLISYVYVRNLAYGIHLLINSKNVNGPYLIGDGNMTWYDFVKLWADKAGTKMPKLNTSYGLIFPFVWLMEKSYKLFRSKKGPPLKLYNIRIPRKDLAFKFDKMAKETGYIPKISLNESIEITLKYYFENYKKNN